MSNPTDKSGQTRPKKKLIINAFVEMCKSRQFMTHSGGLPAHLDPLLK